MSPPLRDVQAILSPSSGSQDGVSLAPRLRSLETQAQLQATEIALLRQLGDDLGSWRYRVDSASTQTAHVLQHLNKELDDLKANVASVAKQNSEALSDTSALAAQRGAVDDLVSQMHGCYKDLQTALGRISASQDENASSTGDDNNNNTVVARLKDVEDRLAATQALMANQDTDFRIELSDLKADTALTASYVQTTMQETSDLSAQVQALRLGLEVVEQSLEDLDVTDALANLRSRVDDLDSGVEHAGDEALAQIAVMQSSLEGLRHDVEKIDQASNAALERAERAEAAAAAAAHDVATLRRDVSVVLQSSTGGKATHTPSQALLSNDHNTPGVSAPPSPSPSSAPSPSPSHPTSTPSDPRLKAAVHTLSDGYRSLHRAMSLMYEEQSDVATRVGAVGTAAALASSAKKNNKTAEVHCIGARIKALNAQSGGGSHNSKGIGSHPIPLTARTLADHERERAREDGKKQNHGRENHADVRHQVEEEMVELRALVAAQAAESAQQQRKTVELEVQLTEMRKLLSMLAPSLSGTRNGVVVGGNDNGATNDGEEEVFYEPEVEEALPLDSGRSRGSVSSGGEEVHDEEEYENQPSPRVSLELDCDVVSGKVSAAIINGEGRRVVGGGCKITRAAAAVAVGGDEGVIAAKW